MNSPFTPSLDKIVKDTLQRFHIPGISVAVVQGEHTCTKGYGIAQQDGKVPVDPNTLFYVASTTKAQLCATWALYIASEANINKPKHEQVSWSTPLADIIREDFVLSDPVRTTQVTLEDAVSHRTGLPRHELSYGYEGLRTPRDVVRNLRNLFLHNELRTKWEYCNTPFVAASLALETLTGKPLAEYMREMLWGPLGMVSTYGGYDEAAAAVEKEHKVLAKGASWSKLPSDHDEKDGKLLEEDHYMSLAEITGAGWVISSAEDYAKWMRAWLEPSSGPLTEELIKELWSPRAIVPEGEGGNLPGDGTLTYALGWFVSYYKGHKLIWHPGSIIGAGSLVLLIPDLKWGVTIFANVQDAGLKIAGLIVELAETAIGVPENERAGKKTADDKAVVIYQGVEERYQKAKEKLYPNAPEKPSVPLGLPLDAYAGKYHHRGYGQMTLVVRKGEEGEYLEWNITDRTWPAMMILRHVNAEYWMVFRDFITPLAKTVAKAESKIGADSRVKTFELAMEPEMADTMVRFERVE